VDLRKQPNAGRLGERQGASRFIGNDARHPHARSIAWHETMGTSGSGVISAKPLTNDVKRIPQGAGKPRMDLHGPAGSSGLDDRLGATGARSKLHAEAAEVVHPSHAPT